MNNDALYWIAGNLEVPTSGWSAYPPFTGSAFSPEEGLNIVTGR